VINNNLFTDDLSVPDETRIYYSKRESIIWLIISAILLTGLIYTAFVDSKSYMAVVIMGAVFSYVLYSSIKSLTNKSPQIILNATGIQAGKLPFYFWNEIENDEVVTKIRKGPVYFLKYNSPSGTKKISISVLDINHKKLEKLLIIYRGRSNCKVS